MTPDANDPNRAAGAFEELIREEEAPDLAATPEPAGQDGSPPPAADSSESGPQEPAVEADPLVRMQTELAQTKDRWLRAMAELENLRKRSRREIQTSTNLAKASLLRELIEVVDNFGRALESAPWENQDATVTAFVEGVRMIYKQFVEILNQNGLRRIEARGVLFDPNLHEAISQIETDEVPSQHVVQVVQEGYLLNDMVVRPARVVVAV